MSLGLAFGIIFTKKILYAALTPFQKMYYNVLFTANVFNITLSFVKPLKFSVYYSHFLEMLYMFGSLIFALFAYKKSYSAAKYLIISFPVIIIFSIIYLFRYSGIIPINPFTIYSLQIGTTIEILILGMTLAEKYNTISIDYVKHRSIAIEQRQRNQLREIILTNLKKQLILLADISQKLSAPLLIIYNIHQSLERRWHTSPESFYNYWNNVNLKMTEALQELKHVSIALEQMRESESRFLEATKLIKEESVINDKDTPI